jgi:host factor-I protein
VSVREDQEMTIESTSSLQDTFLQHLCDSNIDMAMFLVNRIRLQGRINRFDNYTIQLVRGSSVQVVFKHAVSAINPAEPIKLMDSTSFG